MITADDLIICKMITDLICCSNNERISEELAANYLKSWTIIEQDVAFMSYFTTVRQHVCFF